MSDTSPARDLADQIVSLILQPTARDKQIQIGPSNIGDPCDKCLGLAMAGILPDGPRAAPDRFNLLAWEGSAVHLSLELSVQRAILGGDPKWWGVRTERKVSIGEVEGYGEVSGSIDISGHTPPVALDYKMRSKRFIQKWRPLKTLPPETKVQGHTYGYGMELEGNAPEEVGFIIIPRDSMDPRDIWIHVEKYKRKVALKAKKRAARIFRDFVIPGKTALLTTHPDCYNCSSWGNPKVRFKETDNS